MCTAPKPEEPVWYPGFECFEWEVGVEEDNLQISFMLASSSNPALWIGSALTFWYLLEMDTAMISTKYSIPLKVVTWPKLLMEIEVLLEMWWGAITVWDHTFKHLSPTIDSKSAKASIKLDRSHLDSGKIAQGEYFLQSEEEKKLRNIIGRVWAGVSRWAHLENSS